MVFVECATCKEELPENAFQSEPLQTWRANKQYHMITCASCVIARDAAYVGVTRACCRCKEVLPLQAAAETSTRHWSSTLLRVHLDKPNVQMKWTCYDCQCPACTVCKQRPRFTVNSDVQREGYRCEGCGSRVIIHFAIVCYVFIYFNCFCSPLLYLYIYIYMLIYLLIYI